MKKNKNLKNKILATVSVLVVAMLAVMIAMPTSFHDVPTNHWAYSYIQKAAGKGWVSGVGDNRYAPNSQVTVAEWTTMLARSVYPEESKKAPKAGQWYSDKWYGSYVQVALDKRFYFQDPNDINLFTQKNMDRPITRAEMACMAGSVLEQNWFDLTQDDMDQAESSIPDFDEVSQPNDNGFSYSRGVMYAYHYGVISGVDSTGRFDGFARMDRAQAATVLCRLMEVLETQDDKNPEAQPEVKPDPQPQPQPQPDVKPETPTGNYGPVGTVSDFPVKLSYETHKPVTDYWAQNSEQFKARIDRDMYNAAVQSLIDYDASGERNGQVGRTQANIYYNYAVFNKTEDIKRMALDIQDSGVLSNYSLSDDLNDYNAIWMTINQKNGEGYKHFKPYVDQITSSMSDKEAAEICMKAITDNWSYGLGGGSWRKGEFVGQCGELARAYQQVMSAAKIPCIYTATKEHAWTYVKLDGVWYIADPTLAVHASDAGQGATCSWLKRLRTSIKMLDPQVCPEME